MLSSDSCSFMHSNYQSNYQSKYLFHILNSKLDIEPSHYQPLSLIPDYSKAYSYENTENANPNITPLQNISLNNYPENEVFNPDVDSILNPSVSRNTLKPSNFSSAQASWRGNLSNNKYPSELHYSPIDQVSDEKPYAPPKPMSSNLVSGRVNGISPTQLNWDSSGAKSVHKPTIYTEDDDEDEEEQQPRALPVHITSHMAQYTAPQVQMQYQMPQVRSPPQPM